VAKTLELVSGEPFPVGPDADYAQAAGDALGALSRTVDNAGADLRQARTPRAQAAAARRLRDGYRRAAGALRGQELSPADRSANARLVAALNDGAKAYGQAASAAADNNKAHYRRASQAVTAAQGELDGALEGLRAAGYEIGS
jgi:hypothetical protein